MMYDVQEVYLGVEKKHEEELKAVLESKDLQFCNDDQCHPMDLETTFVLFAPYVSPYTEEETISALVANKIPFNLFYSSNSSFGWKYGRLGEDGELQTNHILRDGDMISIDLVAEILNESASLDEAKQKFKKFVSTQDLPNW